jgi:hypothetical protein
MRTRHPLALACSLAAAAAAASTAPAPLGGSLVSLRCGVEDPTTRHCFPGLMSVVALDLLTLNESTILALPNATDGTRWMQSIATTPASSALLLSLVSGDNATGELVTYSLSERTVVSRVPAPACTYLAVAGGPTPASALCLTGAPFYGAGGSTYLLRINASTGETIGLAEWGAPFPAFTPAVYHPVLDVLYAVLPDPQAGVDVVLGWSATTGALLSRVAVPDNVQYRVAAWDAGSGRVLGVTEDVAAGTRDFAAFDMANGGRATINSTSLTSYYGLLGPASAAPAAGAVFVVGVFINGSNWLAGADAANGALAYSAPAVDDLLSGFVYVAPGVV